MREIVALVMILIIRIFPFTFVLYCQSNAITINFVEEGSMYIAYAPLNINMPDNNYKCDLKL